MPLNPDDLRGETERAWKHLGFPPVGADTQAAFWRTAAQCWRERLEASESL